MDTGKRIWRKTTLYYVVALTTVAILSIVGQILIQQSLKQQEADSQVVNVAGRQRMLSQKIVKCAMTIRYAKTSQQKEKYGEELKNARNLWYNSYRDLKNGNISKGFTPHNSEIILDKFEKIEPNFDRMLKSIDQIFLVSDTTMLDSAIKTLLLNEHSYLLGMDAIVNQYASEAKARVEWLTMVEKTLLTLTLLILALEGILIFRPIVGKIRDVIVQLDQQNGQLKELNEELNVARIAALESSRAKSAFLATMSHEIRTPMNGVIGMTSLLQNTKLNTEQQEFLSIIRSSGENLLSLINDILDFSKIEANKVELEQHPFDLYQCIEDAVDLFAENAYDKKLELISYIAAGTPRWVISDSTRIRQIIVNLLSNAIKFTSRGEVVIKVEPDLKIPEKIHFSVQDSGIGIDEESQKNLFESFVQADSSTTRKFGGTGLGLSICKSLTELLGGEIWVESEEGRGTTFHFNILIELDDKVTSDQEKRVKLLQDKHVLIVDDNAVNRQIQEKMVAEWGMIPHVYESPFNVMAYVSKLDHIEVAILDMDMPELDGLKLARLLKEWYPELPILIFSSIGDFTKDDILFATMTKPVKREALKHILICVFESESGQTEQHVIKTKSHSEELMPVDFKPMQILLVEDNPVNQKVAKAMLKRMGYDADMVGNGLEAVRAVKMKTYDIVLMDVHMPEMDGVEATSKIRSMIEEEKQPWIIALTANAMQGDKEKFLDSGMDDYISKPVRIEDLQKAFRNFEDKSTKLS